MQRKNTSKPLKWHLGCLLVTICPLLISLFTITSLSSGISYHQFIFTFKAKNNSQIILPHAIQTQVSTLQAQVGVLLEQMHSESSESKAITKFSDQVLHIALSLDKLADSISGLKHSNPPSGSNEISKVDENLGEPEESDLEEGTISRKIFNSGELLNYKLPKSNRPRGKKNFLGVEAINPSVGQVCAKMAVNVDYFMTYKAYGICPDDWDAAQKLIVSGCDPLPRRRCFSRAPAGYSKPLPINSSLWTQPSDVNILWNHYKCKDYSCLVSNETTDRRGFFKCTDCFNISKRGWDIPTNESTSEFSIDEVLRLKPEEIRIGLDFSPTTGTFAAMMRERNITIASATLNLGAPFSEVIALRGLLPLYISIGSRLPFFDNTLDIVHSTMFLDGWIGAQLLQFVLFDWDRVLRPKGILWVDRFFCKKDDMNLYLDEFSRLGYRKLLWRIVPKTDKLGDELFFSAVLEKPRRG